jgi:hypothetical protein
VSRRTSTAQRWWCPQHSGSTKPTGAAAQLAASLITKDDNRRHTSACACLARLRLQLHHSNTAQTSRLCQERSSVTSTAILAQYFFTAALPLTAAVTRPHTVRSAAAPGRAGVILLLTSQSAPPRTSAPHCPRPWPPPARHTLPAHAHVSSTAAAAAAAAVAVQSSRSRRY